MSTVRTLILLAVLAGIFFFFRPQIMQFIGTLKSETRPFGTKGSATYQEFKQHDMYKQEKGYINKLEEMNAK